MKLISLLIFVGIIGWYSVDEWHQRDFEKQHYIYQLIPEREAFSDGPTPDEMAIMRSHFKYLKQLEDLGVVILAGPRKDMKYGIAIFKASSYEEAETIMLNDPSVKQKIMRGEVSEIDLAIFNPDNF